MGIGAWWHWLIVLVVVAMVFGTKKLRNIGSDVGGAVKNFKEAMGSEQADTPASTAESAVRKNDALNLIEAEVVVVPAVKATPRKTSATAKPAAKKVAASKAAAKPRAAAKPKATTTSKTK